MKGFTAEELKRAKSTDLVQVAERLGYTAKRIGRMYTLKEMDSIRIYNRSSWYRFSNGTGGSQIDFLLSFTDMDICEAVHWLLEFTGISSFVTEQRKEHKEVLVLPTPAQTNDYLIQYLSTERMLSDKVIRWFIKNGLIYEEDRTHNIVFVGRDKENVVRQIYKRGTYRYDQSLSSFKCDVAGSDKEHYGFSLYGATRAAVNVFEAAIDLMSYVDLFQDYDTPAHALGCLSKSSLEVFLNNIPEIHTINLWLDTDKGGIEAAKKTSKYFEHKGYTVHIMAQKEGCKDMNETLCSIRKEEGDDKNAKV